MKIALAQLNATVGALQHNADALLAHYRDATAAGAGLVVSPELYLTGYPPEDLLHLPSFLDDVEATLQRMAAHVGSVPLLVGAPWRDGNKLKNGAAILRAGNLESWAGKCHLPNYGPFDEVRYFSKHSQPTVLSLPGLTVGVSICEDLWTGNAFSKKLVQAGAEVIVNLSASPYHRDKHALRLDVFGKRARSQRVPVAMCNLVGGQDELIFDGHSFVLDGEGDAVGTAPGFAEALLLVELNKAGAVNTVSGGVADTDASPAPEAEVCDALCLGLRDYVNKNGFGTVLIGMSGGIDSALVGALAARALGPERVEAVSMPSRYNSNETRSDARDICQALGIGFREISIEQMFGAALDTLGPHLGDSTDWGVTPENIQARTRGQLLMSLSNRYGWMVVATGNKSELAMGYATLYGDMVGGYALIKDLTKTWVYRLSRWLVNAEGMGIPLSIIERAPSAELRENQTDQDSLPPYEVLDPILEGYIEDNLGVDALLAIEPDRDLVTSVVRAVDRNEYKRRQAAPGPRVTQRVFGKDRRMPITQGWSRS